MEQLGNELEQERRELKLSCAFEKTSELAEALKTVEAQTELTRRTGLKWQQKQHRSWTMRSDRT